MACNPVGASRSIYGEPLTRRLQAMLVTAMTLVNVRGRSAQASPTASSATGSVATPGQRSGSTTGSSHQGRSVITQNSSGGGFVAPRGVAAEATPP